MRVLHSADLHLQDGVERTIDGLDALLTEARERDVEVVTLSGDLFHSQEDASELRPTLRNKLADNPFEIVGIPGNHDTDCYERSLEFGQDFTILHREPFDHFEVNGKQIVGVPYRNTLDDELFSELKEAGSDSDNPVLMLHCTLDIGFRSGEMGGEETADYFPVQRATLGDFGFDYVLAGHIHSDLSQTALPNGGQFIYPGSPVSHSWKELGPRHAVLVDTGADEITPIRLDTFYYDRFTDMVVPGHEDTIIDDVRAWTESHEGASCELEITLGGFIQRDESAFDEKLRSAAGSAEVTNNTKTVQEVLEHPLYTDFTSRLNDFSLDEFEHVDQREEVETHVLEVMAQLLDNRKIRA